jgi:tetratricopeptide (TPR) repeat protein
MFRNKIVFILIFIFSMGNLSAQNNPPRSPLDPTNWGVVYDVPATKNVKLKPDVPYFKDARGTLTIDVYTPPDLKAGEKLPAVVFLNAIGDAPNGKVKHWEIYKSFPRLVAAHGMVGISMEADGTRIQENLRSLFDFLAREGDKHGIDGSRLGVYAASANTTQSLIYLMSENASKGIRAAALYYGVTPTPETRLRKDLPVLFILAEGDLQGLGQQSMGLWQRVAQTGAPWTLMFASNLPHAFDAFSDNDESRRIIQQTLAFWKSHLETVPQPSWKPSESRAIVAALYGSDNNKSAALLQKYTTENPNDAEGFIHYARVISRLQRFDEAFAAFEKASRLDANNPAIFAGMGQIRFAQKRYAEAAPFLTKAIDGGFRNSLLYGQLAYSQLALNQNEEAIKTYEKAFEMGIPPGATTRGLAYYNLAIGYFRVKQNDKGFEMLNKAVDEGFNNRATYEGDTDFASIRTDARFQQLLARLPKL